MNTFLIVGLTAILLVVAISLWSTETPADSMEIDEDETEKTEDSTETETAPAEPSKTEEEVRDEPKYYGGEQGADE